MTTPDEQFKELREDISEGFKTVNSRIDNLVARNEFAAEVNLILNGGGAPASAKQIAKAEEIVSAPSNVEVPFE